MTQRFSDRTINILIAVFIGFQIILFPLIQLTPADVSAISSYVSIILVFVFSFASGYEKKETYLIRAGLFFTLLADYCLVVDGDKLLLGVIFFILTQTFYCAYLVIREENEHIRRANVISRIILSSVLIVATFVVLKGSADALAIASVLYYGNLVVNIVFAFLQYRRDRLFPVGLLLFSLCDLCIGLDVLFSAYLELETLEMLFYSAYHNLPWVFYQPSQVLIALSIICKRNEKV